jgi:hypothetical protein
MADPVEPKETPVASEAPPVVTEAPPVAASESAPIPSADPAPTADSSPGGEAPAAQSQPERTPSLLEAAIAPGTEEPKVETPPAEKVPEAKPAEEKAAEPPKAEAKPEEKPAETKAEEKPPEPTKPEPIEYLFKAPETLQMDDAVRGEFTTALDEFRADPQAGSQKLLDMHVAQLVKHDEHLRNEQYRIFNETKKGWRDQVQADEMLGGPGHRTAMGQVAMVRNMFVSDHPQGSKQWKADLQEFNNALDATGAGDHPAILRVLYRMARFVNEPSIPTTVDPKPAPGAGKRNGADTLYDNDRSPRGNSQ